MSLLSDFEDRVTNAVEGVFAGVFRSPVQPAELAKALAKQMDKGRSVGVGKVYAPTLYTVLISPADDEKFGAFQRTLEGELTTYLVGYAREQGYELPNRPLVRFLVDDSLRLGRFEAYAELASQEELARVAAGEDEDFDVDIDIAKPEPSAPSRAGIYDHEAVEPPAVSTPGPVGSSNPPAPPAGNRPIDPPSPDAAEQPTTVLGVTSAGMATVTVTGIEHDVVLRGDRMTVGRLASCDIAIQDANASRTHAAFVAQGGGWAVEDLGSTNGTRLNERPLDSTTTLHSGDVVTVGITELVYHGPEA